MQQKRVDGFGKRIGLNGENTGSERTPAKSPLLVRGMILENLPIMLFRSAVVSRLSDKEISWVAIEIDITVKIKGPTSFPNVSQPFEF